MISEYEHPIERIMSTAMSRIKTLVDTDTIIGNPVKTPEGLTIIPVSRVTLGFVTGGGEYSDINNNKKIETFPFASGVGGGVNVKPIGFLVDNGKGVKMLSIDGETSYDKLLDIVPELIESLMSEKKQDKDKKEKN